jgi:hypothetical protein
MVPMAEPLDCRNEKRKNRHFFFSWDESGIIFAQINKIILPAVNGHE